MFASLGLRYRLLASFLVVMAVTLLMAALPLLVLLQNSPAPREESLRMLRAHIDETGIIGLADALVDDPFYQPEILRLLNLGHQDFDALVNYVEEIDDLIRMRLLGEYPLDFPQPEPFVHDHSFFPLRGRPDRILNDWFSETTCFGDCESRWEPISLEHLSSSAARMGLRFLLIHEEAVTDGAQPVILFDSEQEFALGDRFAGYHQDTSLSPVNWRGDKRFSSHFGDFSDGNGEQWVFYSMNWDLPLVLDESTLPQRTTVVLAEKRQSQWEALREPLLLSLAVSTLVAIVLAFFISRSIGKPLLSFARAADAVAEGDLEQRVPVSGPPEMRDAAQAFNHMSEQVRATQRAQRDLLANISHDLRTPLTSIQGFSQAIMDGAAKRIEDAARIINQEAGRMNRMVSTLLDLSKLDEGIATDSMNELNFGALLRGICERMQLQARENGIQLSYEVDDDLPLLGDADRLEQVVINLLSNALQFTPEGGKVILRAERIAEQAHLLVEDTGPGVPLEQRERIFERFYQVDSARSSRRGAGLGLSIVRQIVTSHGGTVRVEAVMGEKGARFIVTLPLYLA